MATITKRIGKKGVSYLAQVRLAGYPQQAATFDSRPEAARWASSVEHALLTGTALPGEDVPRDDKLLAVAIDEYLLLMQQDLRRSRHTILTDRDTGRRLIGRFGNISMRGLKKEDIEEYKADRLQVVGPSSVRQDLSMLKRIYEVARIRWRLDIPFPGADVKLPAPPPNRKTVLHPDQIVALLEQCGRSENKLLRPLIILLLSTGMRPEEAVLLRWRQVDLEHLVLDLTKTKTDPRKIPLPDDCAGVLRGIFAGHSPHELIFVTEEVAAKDNPVRFFRRAFEQACMRAKVNSPLKRDVSRKAAEGLQEEQAGVRVTLYTLRHTAATYLLMAGGDIRTIADILGHSQISQTAKYTHMIDSHKRSVVNNPDLPWK